MIAINYYFNAVKVVLTEAPIHFRFWSNLLNTSIVASWASIICFEIDKPNPE